MWLSYYFINVLVKSFRSEEEVLRSNEAQSEEIEAQIKTVRQHINLVSNNLKASERTFIIQMINIALKETEIYQQVFISNVVLLNIYTF